MRLWPKWDLESSLPKPWGWAGSSVWWCSLVSQKSCLCMNLLALQSGNLIIASTVALKEYPVQEVCIHTWYVPQFLLFPHMEVRLMFHRLWTNSSCHGYHSLEFPVSWVIKFPTVILLYWFVSVTPYFFGLLSLRTFLRLLGSPQAFAFCTPVLGRIKCFSQGVWRSRVEWRPPGAQWAPGSAVHTQLVEICAAGNPSLTEQPCPRPVQLQHCIPAVSVLCSAPPRVLSAGEVQNNFICPPQELLLVPARVSGQPACWNSPRESAGIWWALGVPVSGPTITKGLHLADGIWGPLQHC